MGLAAQLLSGSKPQPGTLSLEIVTKFQEIGFSNGYAAIGAGAVLFFLFKAALSLWVNHNIGRFLADVEGQHSQKLYAGILASNLSTRARWGDKALIHGLLEGIYSSLTVVLVTFSVIVGEFALLLAVSIFLFSQSPLVFLAVAGYFVVFAFGTAKFINAATGRLASELYKESINLQVVTQDSLNNARQLISPSTQSDLSRMFGDWRIAYAKKQISLNLLSYIPRYVIEAALMLGLALVLIQRSLDGGVGIPLPTVAIFLAGSFRIIASMMPLQAAFATLKRVSKESETTFALLDDFRPRESSLGSSGGNGPGTFTVTFDRVTFRYPGSERDVLSGVNIKINPGQFVAITGRSGAGKSTFADLLLGLEHPSEGSVLIGGLAPRDALRRQPNVICYVPQRPQVFHGSVYQNVTLNFDPGANVAEEVTALLDDVDLTQAVAMLPNGLGTQLGTDAASLSGGQLQRLALARALYQKPSIIVLDEVTSALDPETESTITRLIESLRGRVTVIAIAHRKETLEQADLEIHFEGNGRVAILD